MLSDLLDAFWPTRMLRSTGGRSPLLRLGQRCLVGLNRVLGITAWIPPLSMLAKPFAQAGQTPDMLKVSTHVVASSPVRRTRRTACPSQAAMFHPVESLGCEVGAQVDGVPIMR